VEAKADVNARNEFKRRPFDEAFGRNHTEICELLAPKTDFNADCPPEAETAEGSGEAASAEVDEKKDSQQDGATNASKASAEDSVEAPGQAADKAENAAAV